MNTKNFIGSIFLEKYKILKLISKGGMDSEIYLAENIENKNKDYFSKKYKFAAIKIIHKANDTIRTHWNRMLDEWVTNASLNESDYIVKVFDRYFPDENTVVLVLEYIDGPSLKMLIRERAFLNINEVIWIFKQILFGVKDMHQKDRTIIHRDLKPENILLSKDLTQVKIVDFGVASVFEKESDNINITDESTFFGTIPYLTPDIIKKKVINGKSFPIITKQYDFHALGIILYEMLVGDKPFEIFNENDTKTIFLFKKFDINSLNLINPYICNEIENIFLRLTSSKDDELKFRYDNVDEIIRDINDIEIKLMNNSLQTSKLLKGNDVRKYQNVNLLLINKNLNLHDFWNKNKIFSLSLSFIFIVLFISLILFFISGIWW